MESGAVVAANATRRDVVGGGDESDELS